MEGRCGLLFHISRKLLIVFQNVLVLIPVAGENIRDQRFRFRNCQVILVLPPGNLGKMRGQNVSAVFLPKAIVQTGGGENDAVVKRGDEM